MPSSSPSCLPQRQLRELMKKGIAGMLNVIQASLLGSALMLLEGCANLQSYQTPCVQGHVCECVQYTTVKQLGRLPLLRKSVPAPTPHARNRLGGDPAVDEYPDKPPRMRWATYNRLMDRLVAADIFFAHSITTAKGTGTPKIKTVQYLAGVRGVGGCAPSSNRRCDNVLNSAEHGSRKEAGDE
jgi:hypothetical protein